MADKKNVEIPNNNPRKEEKNPRLRDEDQRNQKAPQKGDEYR